MKKASETFLQHNTAMTPSTITSTAHPTTTPHMIEREYQNFPDQHRECLSELLDKRENKLYWYKNSDRHFELFSEYLQEDPP